MAILQIDLTLDEPFGTPFRSNTLFGHLCWALRYSRGEAELGRLLDGFDEAPVRLSDAFPHGHLPRPLTAPMSAETRHALGEELARGSGLSRSEAMARLKTLRKRRWVSRDTFVSLRAGFGEHALYRAWLHREELAPDPPLEVQRAGNQINRLTSRTPSEGGLYFQQEHWFGGDGPHLCLFADPGSLGEDLLLDLLEQVGRNGYGRDASTGRGRFRVSPGPPADDLFRPGGNRLMSLSRGVLTENTTGARYRLSPHFGRLGGHRANAAAGPFKRPLLLTEPGATFDNEPGPHGALLRGVHPALDDVCENAYHLCVPFTEAAS